MALSQAVGPLLRYGFFSRALWLVAAIVEQRLNSSREVPYLHAVLTMDCHRNDPVVLVKCSLRGANECSATTREDVVL
jgi:hypothetical protein